MVTNDRFIDPGGSSRTTVLDDVTHFDNSAFTTR
jgi:hypothetical protein